MFLHITLADLAVTVFPIAGEILQNMKIREFSENYLYFTYTLIYTMKSQKIIF